MKNESPWNMPQARYRQLSGDQQFDVAIVGGGITGLVAAYLLKQSGTKVCVLERDRLGSGDTGRTTAHLTYQTDLRIRELVRVFGEERAALALRAGEAAINLIEANVRQRQIDCGFRRVPGYLHASWNGTKDESETFRAEAEQARKWGFPVSFLSRVPFCDRAGIHFPDQAKFDPLKYIGGLARLVDGEWSAVFEQSEVLEINDEPFRLQLENGTVQANYLIIATHVPLMGKSGLIAATLFQSKIYPYSSYAIGATLPKGKLPEACFWDTTDPYFYLRVESGGQNDYVIFGGADHKTGQADDTDQRFKTLEQTLQAILPDACPDRRWSGQVVETNDGLPFIGEIAPQQFVATGYSGNGMTFGTVAGMMACDAVLGRRNPWSDLFSVHRKTIRGGAWDYLVENMDYPYYFVKDRLLGEREDFITDVKPGEGRIVKVDGEVVACYRHKSGAIAATSARCTHMGCLVRWNNAEQTWDCPCHGSRFHPSGEVLAGPAESPLPAAELKSESARLRE
jgi:glycine/D-amino acid oxidase-like deaminating enzyme/nitrite reductase/ring-hydroxylating ferredoxin subunit